MQPRKKSAKYSSGTASGPSVKLWPAFGFSDTWQLVINTTTMIVTFLVVFLIQNTQNRDAKALAELQEEFERLHARLARRKERPPEAA